MNNTNVYTNFMKAIMILSSYFYLTCNKDSNIAWPGRLKFPCMSLRLFFPSLRVFNQSCNSEYNNTI